MTLLNTIKYKILTFILLQKTYISYSSSPTIVRACVPSSVCKAFNVMIAGYGVTTTCCTTNLCNSADLIKINFASLAFPLLALIYMKN